ncbi:MAG: hypothetical protein WCE68_10825 [Anaerolineales bacterium]
MPRSGHRHRLVLYTYMLDRWWKYTLWIGIFLLGLAAGLGILPVQLPQYHFLWVSDEGLWAVAGAGMVAVVLSLFLAILGRLAYVQPFPTHLRLVTPFLRLNISYRRIQKASSVEMQHLFPPGQSKGLRRRLLRPLVGRTAIVLEMRGWPVPRRVLSLFLSPFFFPDKTTRLALLVPKWMEFSMEMESFRSTWVESQSQADGASQSALLASLSQSKK